MAVTMNEVMLDGGMSLEKKRYMTPAGGRDYSDYKFDPWKYNNNNEKKGTSLNDYADKVRKRVEEKLKTGDGTSSENYIPDVDWSRSGLEHMGDGWPDPEPPSMSSKWLWLGGGVLLLVLLLK